MRFLGIDLGEKRVGLAVSDKTNLISTPLKVITSENLLSELKLIVEEYKITDVILGFPKNMNNTLGDSAQKALDIKEEIIEQLKVNVCLQDERRSTIAANKYMTDSNMSRNNRKKNIDSMAAAIILQTYLDRRDKNGR